MASRKKKKEKLMIEQDTFTPEELDELDDLDDLDIDEQDDEQEDFDDVDDGDTLEPEPDSDPVEDEQEPKEPIVVGDEDDESLLHRP